MIEASATSHNDDYDNSNSQRTPVATREIIPSTTFVDAMATTISTPTPTTSISEARAEPASPGLNASLLRDWNSHALLEELQHVQLGPAGDSTDMPSPVPPVAPAVVLGDRIDSASDTSPGHRIMMTSTSAGAVDLSSAGGSTHGMGGGNGNYSYPVATFVSNLVRNVSEMRETFGSHIYAATAIPEHYDAAGTTSATATSFSMSDIDDHGRHPHMAMNSSRSEPSNIGATFSSVHALNDLDDGNQEYVLIDGDLVAIPPVQDHYHGNHHRNRHHFNDHNTVCSEEQDLEDGNRGGRNNESSNELDELDFMENHDRTNCKRSRMRRGVGKFTKWKKTLKKKLGFKKDSGEQQGTGSLSESDSRGGGHITNTSVSVLDDDSAQCSLPQQSQTHSRAPRRGSSAVADDDASTGNTTAVHSFSENSSAAISSGSGLSANATGASPSRRNSNRFPKKKKGPLGWLRDSDRSQQSYISSSNPSLLQQQKPLSSSVVASVAAGAPEAASLNHSGGLDALDDRNSSIAGRASSSALAYSSVARAAMPTLNETSMELPPHRRTAAAVESSPSPLDMSSMASAASAMLTAMGDPMPLLRPDVPHQNNFNDSLTPSSFHRSSSIAAEASFVGNADSLFVEAGVLPDSVTATEYYIEDRLDDYDKYDKKDALYDPYLRSVVPRDSDFKVDKMDTPCVDSMLRMAGQFAEDLEASVQDTPLLPPLKKMVKGKSDGGSVPLSMAGTSDALVHNDFLKLVMVGANDVDKSGLARSLRKTAKKPRKRTNLGVDVHSWMPPNADNVKFTVWDVQGAPSDANDPYSSNFGAHPGTQSLFFSDRSLYLLVWDMACNNTQTYRRQLIHDSDDEDDDHDENGNECLQEEANRQADRALQTDIEDRVLSWVDVVARRGSHSAVLPIALVPSDMSPEEAKRRCDVMQSLLMEHTERKFPEGLVPPKVLSGAETVTCVSLTTNMGMDLLEKMILSIATDASHSVFDHVGTPVPSSTVQVLETVRRLKDNSHKLLLVDHLMAELPTDGELPVESVLGALHFLASIGEVLYFGGSDDLLSHYVILSRKWLVSALSCILRNDLKRELAETRRFMNMQCLYSDQQYPESNVTQTFSNNASSCPVVSSLDTQMLWQSMSFMREAADRSSQLSENSTTCSNMFGFLQHLLVHTGVFLPLDIDRFSSLDNVYFVPSLLSEASIKDVWTYKSSEAWMTTLCHSWLFRDGAPLGLIEQVTVALLRDLYEFSHAVAVMPLGPNHHTPPARSQTFPFGQNSLTQFLGHQDGEPIGQIRLHQIVCWKNSVLIKIGRVFPEGNELRESFVEIFVSVTDQSSPHSVACDAMQSNMQRLVVSGKGQVGHHGKKIWKGGYNIVLDSIKASVASCTNVDRQVVCPECLAHAHPSNASTWSWDSVRAASDPIVRCIRGHRVDRNMICGTIPSFSKADDGTKMGDVHKKPVPDLLPSVVVVGLWDDKSKVVRNVGSGFVVDKKLGLIVTAGHILFNMEEGRDFGSPYFGLKHGRAVIGVIPGGGQENAAVFRYFAEVVAEDIHYVDACVLKISTRLENDAASDAQVGDQAEIVLESCHNEELPSLKLTRRYELEEAVRVLGFNQGGEGLLEQGKHVNRSADFAKGYIVKQFKISDDHSSSSGDSSSSEGGFAPREEIVIMCPTISGHSGGPCVNDEGKVVGILSRADPVERQRCYLVPTAEIRLLVNKARKRGGLKMY